MNFHPVSRNFTCVKKLVRELAHAQKKLSHVPEFWCSDLFNKEQGLIIHNLEPQKSLLPPLDADPNKSYNNNEEQANSWRKKNTKISHEGFFLTAMIIYSFNFISAVHIYDFIHVFVITRVIIVLKLKPK